MLKCQTHTHKGYKNVDLSTRLSVNAHVVFTAAQALEIVVYNGADQ